MLKTEKEYFAWLKGKRVILVGAAGYLSGKNEGGKIDGYDLVIRMNHGIPILHPVDYGSRTDVLYRYIGRENIEELSDIKANVIRADVKWLVVHTDTVVARKKELYTERYFKEVNTIWIDLDFVRFIKAFIERTPNIGTVAISQILQSQVKSIEVIGCDFYASGAYCGYVKSHDCAKLKNSSAHDSKTQLRYLLSIKDQRLTLNKELKDAINRDDL